MADNSKRKDRDTVDTAADDIRESVDQDRNPPKYENPNRDRARGDWDRSRKYTGDM